MENTINFHSLGIPEALAAEKSSPRGLDTSEADGRLARYGENRLAEGKKKSLFARIIEQLKNPMIIVLIVAGAISGAFGEWVDMLIIFAVVALNTVMGIVQEGKADAAIAALKGPLESVKEQCVKYQERRDTLCNGLRDIGWDLPNGRGTMFVWARIPGGRTDSMNFCMELMEKAGVIVTPGASFGPHGEGYVRFALVLPPEKIREAVESIRRSGI